MAIEIFSPAAIRAPANCVAAERAVFTVPGKPGAIFHGVNAGRLGSRLRIERITQSRRSAKIGAKGLRDSAGSFQFGAGVGVEDLLLGGRMKDIAGSEIFGFGIRGGADASGSGGEIVIRAAKFDCGAE